jgi:hypothetical protein
MASALAFMVAGDNVVFTSALVLMVLIGLVEAIGLGGSAIGVDGHADVDGDLLGWLGVGRLPLLMLLVIFLCLFGVIGLSVQQLAVALTGSTFSPWIAGLAAAVVALPGTGILSRPIARILPRDETSAVPIDSLVGRTGKIVTGRATQGSPARARVFDHFGQIHYVMAEPDNPGQSFAEGEMIILVRRDNHVFRAISEGSTLLPQLDP